MMENIALSFLLFFNAFLGIESVPRDSYGSWKIVDEWVRTDNGYRFSATSSAIVEGCKSKVTEYIVFPRVIHSAHKFFLDGEFLSEVGDSTFKSASPYYQQPVISCKSVVGGKELSWTVDSYSKYFSRLTGVPEVKASYAIEKFFGVTANLISAGVIFVIALFSMLIFWGRVRNDLTVSVTLGGVCLALYFFGVSNTEFGISITMLESHKIADMGLWLGGLGFFYAFYVDKLLKKWMILQLAISIFAAIVIIIRGQSGDQIQLGTMIPMIPFLICSTYSFISLIKYGFSVGFSKDKFTRLTALGIFFVLANNDILNIFGLTNTPMMLSVGIVCAVFGLSVAVSQDIEKTYVERDALLINLEDKVAEKTKNLSETLVSLKATQAELIQSARLASLGTLSAGVAHEINNSINYVNGALKPLEKKVMSTVPESDRALVEKLFNAIREGTNLTVEIVKSLRNYTGLNQANQKDVKIHEVVTSVITILKSKLKEVQIDVRLEDGISIFGSVVGLNQIIMNIVSNALDVLPTQGGRIDIAAYKDHNNCVHLVIEDNGSGIPQEIIDRIYDPFFTTKEVGKGTGLGLHIVKKEVERHNGIIKVVSTVGKGTKFEIIFPAQVNEQEIKGVA